MHAPDQHSAANPAPRRSLRDLYPLRGMPRQGQIWSWISFDVANQSFTLIINTLLFSVFFKEVVAPDPARGSTLWAIAFASSMLLVVLASPVAGAMADLRAWKKAGLMVTGFTCALLTCALGLIGPGQVALALLLYIPANFAFAIGENFLSAFLPGLSTERTVARVSGFSWACAYGAALLLLALTAAGVALWDLQLPSQWRPFFVFAGVWFLLLALPTLLFLREGPAPTPAGGGTPGRTLAGAAFARLAESVRNIRRYPDLSTLLLAGFFYGAGIQVVVAFASILAQDFGFTGQDLVIFVAVITISGIAGTFVPALLQDRLGHRRTVTGLLMVWIGTTLLLALYAWLRARSAAPDQFPRWPMWALGNLVGFGLGSLGAANRGFVGFLVPRERAAEVFGVSGMVLRLAAVTTVPFALVKDAVGAPTALLVLAGMLVVGLVLTRRINEQRGHAAVRGEGAGG